MNKVYVPLIYLFILCTLVHWHARTFIFFVAEKYFYFSVQTNWHAQWDMVLLPSLLRNNGRRLQAHVFSTILYDGATSDALLNWTKVDVRALN
jgi:hypothetical protein